MSGVPGLRTEGTVRSGWMAEVPRRGLRLDLCVPDSVRGTETPYLIFSLGIRKLKKQNTIRERR